MAGYERYVAEFDGYQYLYVFDKSGKLCEYRNLGPTKETVEKQMKALKRLIEKGY